jgi:hypothetical protein
MLRSRTLGVILGSGNSLIVSHVCIVTHDSK